MSASPLWEKKNQLKRNKGTNTRYRWHCLKCWVAFLKCSWIKPKLQVLTHLIRLLAQLSHTIKKRKEEIHPWAQGADISFALSHVSSAHMPQSSTWNKNHLLSPSQPLDHWHCFYFWWKFPIAWWMEGHIQGTRKEAAQSIVTELLYFWFSWPVFSSSWGIGTSTIPWHSPFHRSFISSVSHSFSFPSARTYCRLPSTAQEVLAWLARRVLFPIYQG